MVSFFLCTTFFVTEIPPSRDLAKCELLRLYFQFLFAKLLKTLQFFVFKILLEEHPKALLKISLIDVDSLAKIYLFYQVYPFFHKL